MASAYCKECGCEFEREANEAWKKLCLSCWVQTQEPKQSGRAKLDALRETLSVARMQDQIDTLSRRAIADKEMVKRLIQLTHPDKHNNSKGSQIASAWLIEVSKEFR